MMAFWKHYEKVEKEHRRKAEKEAQEQRRIDDEIREVRNVVMELHTCQLSILNRNIPVLTPISAKSVCSNV